MRKNNSLTMYSTLTSSIDISSSQRGNTQGTEWRRIVRNIFTSCQNIVHYFSNWIYDGTRFIQHSGILQWKSDCNSLLAWIRADIHKIEKGLALAQPRAGFGNSILMRLGKNLSEISRLDYSLSEVDRKWALQTLREYVHVQECHSGDALEARKLVEILENEAFVSNSPDHDGLIPISGESYQVARPFHFHEFAWSRYSVRQFDSARPVSRELLVRAVDCARKSPSVCNRQTVRVHLFEEQSQVQAILAIQRGNAGFGDQVPVLAVVTSDLSQFFSPDERHQMWVDGGLFAMTFIYGLHSEGLASCSLNWCQDVSRDQQFRKLGYIPSQESVIMLIAIGHYPESLKVASSSRLPVEYISRFHSL